MAMYQPPYMMGQQYGGYMPQMQQMPTPQPQPMPFQTPNCSIKWVQGIAGAKAYPLAPGQTADLWDSEDQIIYLKTVDMNGMPSMEIIDYTRRPKDGAKKEATQTTVQETYAKQSDFEKALERIDKLERSNEHAESAI